MPYEKKHEPLAPSKVYYKRIARNISWASIIIFITLIIGTVGYHFATKTHTEWLDAFHNASMILSGMGPLIDSGFSDWGKVFSSFYALFSGLIIVGATGLTLAPGIHRIFHKLHLEET